MILRNKKILITGCSFIGSHLIPQLVAQKTASIRIVNLTKKHTRYWKRFNKDIEFYERDLRDLASARRSVKNIDVVFHLAADHGGRGYVDLHQGPTATNLLLDGSVFKACLQENVEKVFFASSGCVYPNFLQTRADRKIYLRERDVTPPYDADNMYGWAKLMGELTLQAYFKDYGMRSAIGRFFTVYGERASESHAVIATILKASIKQDPFQVWGDGTQIRNWTYVEDIVSGMIACVNQIDDATPINLGTTERITVNHMIRLVLKQFNHRPKRITHIKMPVGPMNRVADINRAQNLLNWNPQISFEVGLKKTIQWYKKNKISTGLRNIDEVLIGK